MVKIKGRTENQIAYIKAILRNDLVICIGATGTGKTFIPVAVALDLISRNNSPYKQIIISRPMVATSPNAFPFLKGTIEEKLHPYYYPILCIFEKLIGKQETAKLISSEVIKILPIELMRGVTFDNCIVILDEFQNSVANQMVMSITRMGENCKMIYTGDVAQKDNPYYDGKSNYSGLEYLYDNLKKTDLAEIIKMEECDIQRNPKIAKILAALKWTGNIE